jgi:hypothetical protein
LGQNTPYYLAEDLTLILQELHPNYQQQTVTYVPPIPWRTAGNSCDSCWDVCQLQAHDLPGLFDPTSVESCNKTLHIQAWDDPMEPMDKMPLLPDYDLYISQLIY